MHHPLEQITSEEKKKPKIVVAYNENMGYVDLSDRMANSYSFKICTMKWTKKLFISFTRLDSSQRNSVVT